MVVNQDGGSSFVSNQLYLWRDRLNHRATAIGTLAIALGCFCGAAGAKAPLHKALLMSTATVTAALSLRSSKAHRFADVMVTSLERASLNGWQQNAVQALMPTTKRGNDQPLQIEAEILEDEVDWDAIMQLQDPTAKALTLALQALGVNAQLVSIEKLDDCDRYIFSTNVPFTKVQRLAKDLAAVANLEEIRVSAVGFNVALDVLVAVDYAEPAAVSVDVPVGDAVAVESKAKVESDRLPDGARLIPPGALNDINRYPVVMVVAGQGSGKTSTMGAILHSLDGHVAVASPKPLSPVMQGIADLVFGFDPVVKQWRNFGDPLAENYADDRDLSYFLEGGTKLAGSMLAYCHAAQQESANRQLDLSRDRTPWRCFFDECADSYLNGYVDKLLAPAKNKSRVAYAQQIIADCNRNSFVNWRGQGCQHFIGTQVKTVDSIGLKGFAAARDEAWWLFPGIAAITEARSLNKHQLANWMQRRVDDGFGVALLNKQDSIFEVINLPDLKTLDKISKG